MSGHAVDPFTASVEAAMRGTAEYRRPSRRHLRRKIIDAALMRIVCAVGGAILLVGMLAALPWSAAFLLSLTASFTAVAVLTPVPRRLASCPACGHQLGQHALLLNGIKCEICPTDAKLCSSPR